MESQTFATIHKTNANGPSPVYKKSIDSDVSAKLQGRDYVPHIEVQMQIVKITSAIGFDKMKLTVMKMLHAYLPLQFKFQ